MKKFNKKFITGFSAVVLTALSLTAIPSNAGEVVYGDANCDGKVNMADATFIVQHVGNKDKYKLSEDGAVNADVDGKVGITGTDALAIQKYVAGLIDKLPEGEVEKPVDPVTDATYIHLDGKSATIEGENAEVNGGIITISHSGSYYFDGTLEDGQINVNIADEKEDAETVKIFLNGVNITGKSQPAILITNAENTSINLVDGTENFIADGDTAYADGGAVIEAKDDMTIKGDTGVLNITANVQNAIVCNNDIKINGGTTTITTLNSTDKTNGINGKTSLTVKSGTLIVDAEGDGIKSSKGNVSIEGGNVEIKAGNDAIQAETSIDISGGTVVAGGDRGLTAVTGINITGGSVVATATDNQADTAIMGGTTQGTMLFNMITSSETDGAWKKANSFGDADFTKKYCYVLMSDPSFEKGVEKTFVNKSNSSAVSHDNGEFSFVLKDTVTVFNEVNPSGAVPPTDAPSTPSTDGTYSVTLNGASIKSDAPSDVAAVDNNVLYITKEGKYQISGSAKEVQIVVNVDKTAYPDSVVELDLVGAEISNSTTAPIYVQSIGDEVQIVAKAGTVNTISDGTQHTQTYKDSDGNENTVEGAIFSRDDIKFKGSGTLTVNGNTDDAIVCKNDIKIYNGNITVNAVDDGIRGKDSVTIGNSPEDETSLILVVNTQQGDGIKATSTETGDKSYGVVTINTGIVEIKSYADGIQAEQNFVMNGGDLNIYTYQGSGFTGSASGSTGNNSWGGGFGGGFGGMQDGNSNKTDISAKGIKAVGLYDTDGTTYKSAGNITINGGNITIDSSDDSIHCSGTMDIKGGVYNLKSADDAMHSDATLNIGTENSGSFTDVQVYISKCYEGVEGVTINQCSGTVYIISGDDGYNAAGGSDSSGNQNTGGWNQGGFGGFGGMSSSTGTMNLKGGLVVVNSASGDHDAFDSNGDINITGGYYCANGQEPMDCGDSGYSINNNGGNYISMTAGNTNLTTRYTFLDDSGKAVVSFLSASGAGATLKSGSVQSGGTVSGGTEILGGNVIVGGTLSGGTAVSAGSGSGSGNTPGFPGGRG